MEKMLAEIKMLDASEEEREREKENPERRKEPFLVVCLQDEENGMLLSLSLSLSSITIDKVSQYYRWLVTLDSDVIRLNHGVFFLRETTAIEEKRGDTSERDDDDINANK